MLLDLFDFNARHSETNPNVGVAMVQPRPGHKAANLATIFRRRVDATGNCWLSAAGLWGDP